MVSSRLHRTPPPLITSGKEAQNSGEAGTTRALQQTADPMGLRPATGKAIPSHIIIATGREAFQMLGLKHVCSQEMQ